MTDDIPQAQAASAGMQDRYARSGVSSNAAAAQNDDHALRRPPDDWLAAAVQATTLRELYDIASQAQQAGMWKDRDAAWCRALREALGAGERVTVLQLALLERELGATPV